MAEDIEYRLACLADDLDKLDSRLTKLNNTVHMIVNLFKDCDEVQKFMTYELIKIQCDSTRLDNKTPYRRLQELEESFKGFLVYYHDIGQRKHAPEPIKKIESKGFEIV